MGIGVGCRDGKGAFRKKALGRAGALPESWGVMDSF